MNKFILIILLFFITKYQVFSIYKNPFWVKKDKILKIKNVRLKSIILNSSFSYDFINGVRNSIFYEFGFINNFSDYIFINLNLRVGENFFFLKLLSIKNEFNLLSFLSITFSYMQRPFLQYNIMEHNIVFFITEIIPSPKFYKIYFSQGINFRFIDLNIYDLKTKYRIDWLFYYFILWEINIIINPIYFYSFGFNLSNFNNFDTFSQNYWQFEIINYFHFSSRISCYLNSGAGFSGSFPFAGIINRFWVRMGLRYEIKI